MLAKARVQTALGVCAGLLILGACFGALYWLLAPERFPVRQVELKGNLKNTTRAEIQAALPRAGANGRNNFFAVDLAALRASVERLPWVRRVSVRRAWPDRLEVLIEEHVALARWGTGDEITGLVNVQGERFFAKTKEALPLFIGPGGTAAEVTRRYRRFSQIIAPLGTSVERVVLSPRHAWQLRLGNGVHLMLGRDADLAEVRLQKFVEAHAATLGRSGKRPDYVDLRYPNGFALRMPDGNG
jgi:cell division protein FtsQ